MGEESTVQLVHCIYTSASTVDFSQDEIISLLDTCRKNNLGLEVTGMLLYTDGSFFQVLEGESKVVDSLLNKIERDTRHNKVVRVILENIEEREFAEWTMGYSGMTREELKTIEGLNDFFQSNMLFTDLDEGRAKMLLKGFKQGKWRSTIS